MTGTLALVWTAPVVRVKCSVVTSTSTCARDASATARGCPICKECAARLKTHGLTVADPDMSTIDGAPMQIGLGAGTPTGPMPSNGNTK